MMRRYWPRWDLELLGTGRAFEESAYVLPRQRLALDVGWGRSASFAQPTLVLTHLHMDHALGLPRWVVNRQKMGDGRARVLVPREALPAARRIVAAFQEAEGRRDPVTWEGVAPGDVVPHEKGWRLRFLEARHGIPALIVLLERFERRVKPEFAELPPREIGRLIREGAEPVTERWQPVFAYCGDTEVTALDAAPELYEVPILLLECTFVDGLHPGSAPRIRGHVHWEEILARAERFRNEAVVLTHFSRRYHPDRLWRHLERTCPESLRQRLHLWIDLPGTEDRRD